LKIMPTSPANPSPALISTSRADLCLEFANSRYWRGTGEPTETLNSLDDVFSWMALAKALDQDVVDDLKARWPRGEGDAALFAETIALREALYRIFTAVAQHTSPAASDLALLNKALAAAPKRAELIEKDGAYLWRVEQLRPQLADLLAPVLWTAGDMVAEPRRDRVRLCANDKCVWLFLDDSKGATRRWCSMSACGNRAKAHRHYERKKKGKTGTA
jgi:predicted RNA-binding Zn ribbon-like protein